MLDDSSQGNCVICSEIEEFRCLQMMNDGKSALILGYKISLTWAEYTILDALYKSGDSLTRECFERKYGIACSSIPVHVAHINKKAFPITGRRLIDGIKPYGYRLSESM